MHPESSVIEMHEHSDAGGRRKRAARQYGFDNVFGSNSTQQDVYETVGKPICNDFLRGYNATLLAYGQVRAARWAAVVGSLHIVLDSDCSLSL